MSERLWDVVVIGAGPAGYTAAIRAKQHGLKVLLVEQSDLGGTCLNRGCIPSKALIHCAKLWQQIKGAERFGITVSDARFDWQGMQKWSSRVVNSLRRGLQTLLQRHGVELTFGKATLIASNEVGIEPKSGKPFTADTQIVVLATGSSPCLLPYEPDVPVTSEEQALFLEMLPNDVVIIGGGASGVELAWLFNALGASVTLIEMLPRLLPQVDAELSEGLRHALERQGIKVMTRAKVERIEGRDGKAALPLSDGKMLTADVVVCAVGRKANSMGLADLGIALREDRSVAVNEWQQTSTPSVFAVGDLTHGSWTAHGSMEEGARAAKAIAHLLQTGDLPSFEPMRPIPFCVYCEPQVLRVGITEDEAKQQGLDVLVSRFFWRACGAAVATGEVEGFVKIVADAKTHQVIGVHILGNDAINLSGEVSMIVSMGVTLEQGAKIVRQHPSRSEGVGETLWAALGLPLHTAYGLERRR